MKSKHFVPLLLAFFCFQIYVYPNDTLTIEPGNLNNSGFLDIIKNDKGAHIYKLKRGGIYRIFAPENLQHDYSVTIVGELFPENIRPALIVYVDSDVTGKSTIIESSNNLTLKNLYLTGVVSPDFEHPENGYKRMINFYSARQRNLKLEVSNCVCNYTNDWKGFFNFDQEGGSVLIKNNLVLNMMREDGYIWSGFLRLINTHDSIVIYNNTFFNCPFVLFTYENPKSSPNYFSFQHNTVVNSAMCYYPYSYSIQQYCKNNIFYNTQFLGNIKKSTEPWLMIDYISRVDYEPLAMVRTDTINDSALEDSLCKLVNLPYRTVTYSHNCFYQSPSVKQIPGLIAEDSCSMAMLYSPRTKAMFNSTEWPGLQFDTIHTWDMNPVFGNYKFNEEKLQQFAFKVYRNKSMSVNFIFDPDNNPATFEWPLMGEYFNFCYSNPTLLSASESGFPLGDYYHWFKKSESGNPIPYCNEFSTKISNIYQDEELRVYGTNTGLRVFGIPANSGHFSAKIYTISGVLVNEFHSETLTNNSIEFKSKIPRGIYLCSFSINHLPCKRTKFVVL